MIKAMDLGVCVTLFGVKIKGCNADFDSEFKKGARVGDALLVFFPFFCFRLLGFRKYIFTTLKRDSFHFRITM